MSESCEYPNPPVVHPVPTPLSEFYARVPSAPCDREAEAEINSEIDPAASDSPAFSSNEPVVQRQSSDELPMNECASYFAVKSVVDRVITAMLMVLALPLMIMVGLAIMILDGRPIFYRQIRVGKDGREFRIWKFRTMCQNAESKTGAVWSNSSDPRVTTLGRWLRCSHLDELPQFFNVLMGDMCLIGPRPERPEFVRELSRELPHYVERLNVRPGITGLAQLHLGYDQSVADVQRKVLLDLEYIRTASFAQDAFILMRTLPYIVGKLLAKWMTDRGSLSEPLRNTEVSVELSGDIVGSQNDDGTSPIHRPEPASVMQRSPHVPHFPNVTTDPGAGSTFAPKF